MSTEVEALIQAMPLPTESERRREALIYRLACALEDMAETLPTDHPVRRGAITWKDRDDLEQLLDRITSGDIRGCA